jgi:hypothetical protein
MLAIAHHGLTLFRPRSRLAWWLLVIVMLGLLILAHGCHGPDEDHEL